MYARCCSAARATVDRLALRKRQLAATQSIRRLPHDRPHNEQPNSKFQTPNSNGASRSNDWPSEFEVWSLELSFLLIFAVPSMTRRQLTVAQFVAAIVTLACYVAGFASAPTADLPQQLTSPDFWKLSAELSEANGTFRSDNLLSNEIWLQHVIPELTKTAKTWAGLPRRRARAELHLHRRDQAGHGVHRGRPPRQPAAAPDVQGALRAVDRPRRLRLEAVREEASGRADHRRRRRSRSSTRTRKCRPARRSSRKRSKRSRTIC